MQAHSRSPLQARGKAQRSRQGKASGVIAQLHTAGKAKQAAYVTGQLCCAALRCVLCYAVVLCDALQ